MRRTFTFNLQEELERQRREIQRSDGIKILRLLDLHQQITRLDGAELDQLVRNLLEGRLLRGGHLTLQRHVRNLLQHYTLSERTLRRIIMAPHVLEATNDLLPRQEHLQGNPELQVAYYLATRYQPGLEAIGVGKALGFSDEERRLLQEWSQVWGTAQQWERARWGVKVLALGAAEKEILHMLVTDHFPKRFWGGGTPALGWEFFRAAQQL